jgi:hypothetical protein
MKRFLRIERDDPRVGKRKVYSIIIAVMAVVIPLMVLGLCMLLIHTDGISRQQLLHEVDHPALLAACRELMARLPEYTNGRPLMIHPPEDASRDERVPVLIRQLKPTDIYVTKQYVRIEFAGGHDHFGVIAYAPGEVEGRLANVQLLPGLWYYTQ